MEYTEIKVTVPVSCAEEATAIANMTVPYGVYIEDYSDLENSVYEIAHIDLIDEQLKAKDREHSVLHVYIGECDNPVEAIAFLKERFLACNIDFSIDSFAVDDSEWNENWKKYFKAFEVGKKLAVCPSWEDYENKENRTVIRLDPGAAFGTGGHATTYLCLTELEKYVDQNTELLDIGTGSGILSIAALLLGAKSAVGVDIDELSVMTANKNAERNGVSDKAQFTVGDLADKISGKYDIICANIVADVVIKLLSSVKQFMKENTKFIISGIIDVRNDDVVSAINNYGFKIIGHNTREEWHEYTLTI